MKKSILLAIIAAALVTPIQAQSAPKILVVDVAGVLNNFNEAQSEQKKFQAQVDTVNAQISKWLEEGQALQKQYLDFANSANNPGLSPEGRGVLQKQLEAKQEELKALDAKITGFRNDSAKMLQDQQAQIVSTEVNKIKDAVKQVAIRHGASLVLNNSGIGAVVYFEGTMDITNEILDTLNNGKTASTASGAAAGAMTPSASSGASRTGAPPISLPPIGQ